MYALWLLQLRQSSGVEYQDRNVYLFACGNLGTPGVAYNLYQDTQDL